MRRASLVGFALAALLTGGLVWLVTSLGPPPAPRWTITGRVSAHGALVMHVETRHLDDAVGIARTIGEPLQPRFGEILVFFHRPGRHDMVRRVQWTRAHGYIESIYEDAPR